MLRAAGWPARRDCTCSAIAVACTANGKRTYALCRAMRRLATCRVQRASLRRIPALLTSEFDYDLPPELIAQRPIEPRDASRLLVVHRPSGELTHRSFAAIGDYLRPGDILVANDSRVLPVRLHGRKESGGQVEVLLLTRVSDVRWEALVRGHRLRPGLVIELTAPAAPTLRAHRPPAHRLPPRPRLRSRRIHRPLRSPAGWGNGKPPPPRPVHRHRAPQDRPPTPPGGPCTCPRRCQFRPPTRRGSVQGGGSTPSIVDALS